MRKLQLGCFDSPCDGWINTDITPHIHIARVPLAANLLHSLGKMSDERLQQHRQGVFRKVRRLNVIKRFPFDDNSIDCAFTSHMLEHVHPDYIPHIFGELNRVLKPGAILRVVLPDLEWALSLFDRDHPEECLQGIFQQDETNIKNRHQWMYTDASLRRTFEENGFDDVRICQFRQGRLPDLEKIDNRPENSIYVEGQKPLTTPA